MSATSGNFMSSGGWTGDPPPYYPYDPHPLSSPTPTAWVSTPFVDSELARALINVLKGETTIKVQVELSPQNLEQLRNLITPKV